MSELQFPTPGDLPDPEIESPASPALAGEFFTTVPLEKPNLVLLMSLQEEIWTETHTKERPSKDIAIRQLSASQITHKKPSYWYLDFGLLVSRTVRRLTSVV